MSSLSRRLCEDYEEKIAIPVCVVVFLQLYKYLCEGGGGGGYTNIFVFQDLKIYTSFFDVQIFLFVFFCDQAGL